MSNLPVVCILVILCLQNTYSQIWDPIFEHTGGLSGNLGALHTWPDGATLGGHLHGNLNRPTIFDGFGVRGSTPLGRGWSVGGYGNVMFNPGRQPDFGAGISFTKKFGRRRRRSTSCAIRCTKSCEMSTECLQECLKYMCLLL